MREISRSRKQLKPNEDKRISGRQGIAQIVTTPRHEHWQTSGTQESIGKAEDCLALLHMRNTKNMGKLSEGSENGQSETKTTVNEKGRASLEL